MAAAVSTLESAPALSWDKVFKFSFRLEQERKMYGLAKMQGSGGVYFYNSQVNPLYPADWKRTKNIASLRKLWEAGKIVPPTTDVYESDAYREWKAKQDGAPLTALTAATAQSPLREGRVDRRSPKPEPRSRSADSSPPRSPVADVDEMTYDELKEALRRSQALLGSRQAFARSVAKEMASQQKSDSNEVLTAVKDLSAQMSEVGDSVKDSVKEVGEAVNEVGEAVCEAGEAMEASFQLQMEEATKADAERKKAEEERVASSAARVAAASAAASAAAAAASAAAVAHEQQLEQQKQAQLMRESNDMARKTLEERKLEIRERKAAEKKINELLASTAVHALGGKLAAEKAVAGIDTANAGIDTANKNLGDLANLTVEGFELLTERLEDGSLLEEIADKQAAEMPAAIAKGIALARDHEVIDELDEPLVSAPSSARPRGGARATRATARSFASGGSSSSGSSSTGSSAASSARTARAAAPAKTRSGKAKAPVPSRAAKAPLPKTLTALCSTLVDGDHDAWSARVEALNEPLSQLLALAAANGRLAATLKALAAGFARTIQAKEGQVQFAVFSSLLKLSETHGALLAPLAAARASALRDDTVLAALLGPKAVASTRSLSVAGAALKAAEALVSAAPSVEALQIVCADLHVKSPHAKTCAAAASLIEILIGRLPSEQLAAQSASISAALKTLRVHPHTETVGAQARHATEAFEAAGFAA